MDFFIFYFSFVTNSNIPKILAGNERVFSSYELYP